MRTSLLVALSLALTASVALAQPAGRPEAITVKRTGGNAPTVSSDIAALSSDGRFVLFQSDARRLTRDVGHGYPYGDVFVRDRRRNRTEMVNVTPAGRQTRTTVRFSDGTQSVVGASNATMSRDGRYVVFLTAARDMVRRRGTTYIRAPGGFPARYGWFLRDRSRRRTTRLPALGYATPVFSPDGRTLVGLSCGRCRGDTSYLVVRRMSSGRHRRMAMRTEDGKPFKPFGGFVRAVTRDGSKALLDDGVFVSTTTGRVTPVRTEIPEGSWNWRMSDDARVFTFSSEAALVAEGDEPESRDCHVLDLHAGTLELAYRDAKGRSRDIDGCWLSPDGRRIAVRAKLNLAGEGKKRVDTTFVRDLAGPTWQEVPSPLPALRTWPGYFSADGSTLALSIHGPSKLKRNGVYVQRLE